MSQPAREVSRDDHKWQEDGQKRELLHLFELSLTNTEINSPTVLHLATCSNRRLFILSSLPFYGNIPGEEEEERQNRPAEGGQIHRNQCDNGGKWPRSKDNRPGRGGGARRRAASRRGEGENNSQLQEQLAHK